MAEVNKSAKSLSTYRICGVDVQLDQKSAEWFKKTRQDLADGKAGHRPFYSHETLMRHLRVLFEIGPAARAFTYAINSVSGAENFEVKTHTTPEATRIYMARPTFDTRKFSDKYAALLEDNEKDAVQFDCWLGEKGYKLNHIKNYDLSAEDIKAEIESRVARLGTEYVDAYQAYLNSKGGIDKKWRQTIKNRHKVEFDDPEITVTSHLPSFMDVFMQRAWKPNIDEYAFEVKTYLLPFYKAFHYALSQEREDIGGINIELHGDMIKLYADVLDYHGSRCAEVIVTRQGYSQNAMAPLSGGEISAKDNKNKSFVDFINVLEQAVITRGDAFKVNYERYLMSGGRSEKLPAVQPKRLRLS